MPQEFTQKFNSVLGFVDSLITFCVWRRKYNKIGILYLDPWTLIRMCCTSDRQWRWRSDGFCLSPRLTVWVMRSVVTSHLNRRLGHNKHKQGQPRHSEFFPTYVCPQSLPLSPALFILQPHLHLHYNRSHGCNKNPFQATHCDGPVVFYDPTTLHQLWVFNHQKKPWPTSSSPLWSKA